ncbi:hypothetical protein ACVV2G_27145 [Streptomyces ziwulingensis]
MTEAEKQRARVDQLIVWVEERLEMLGDYGRLSAEELVFPDPHRTPDAPESQPRQRMTKRNAYLDAWKADK